jgi:hypothetical protein
MDLPSSGNQGGLHFPSPPNNDDNRFIFESDQVATRGNPRGQPNLMDNFITIRVFLKVTGDSNNEHLKKLFAKSIGDVDPGTSHLNQTQSLTEHHVNFNGEDQVYIDVSLVDNNLFHLLYIFQKRNP